MWERLHPDVPWLTPGAVDFLDLVVVDGHYRQACVAEALWRLRPGGLLLVDDSQMLRELSGWGVPADWPVASHTSNGLKTTTLWRKPEPRGG